MGNRNIGEMGDDDETEDDNRKEKELPELVEFYPLAEEKIGQRKGIHQASSAWAEECS